MLAPEDGRGGARRGGAGRGGAGRGLPHAVKLFALARDPLPHLEVLVFDDPQREQA